MMQLDAGRAEWLVERSGPEPASRDRRWLRLWFLSGALLTFLILVVGGITRLTESGLSIVEWKPIAGVVPPLGEAQWREAFERYQAFPEYRMLRHGMTLAQFRGIFLWEYAHRLLARLIGLVFLVPCLIFWLRGSLDRALRRRVLVLFGLGALQGFMGWFMVRSGLVSDPHVSHYRLAAHLSIALCILGYCLWLAREQREEPAGRGGVRALPVRRTLAGGEYLVGSLLLLQIVWGAFVAGMDAGTIYNTFPRMNGRLVPEGALSLRPALRNLVENPATVQWTHRLLGTLLVLAALAVFARSRRAATDRGTRRLSALFAGLVLVQYGLGILTLLRSVPVPLGALHQATAVLLFGVWVTWLHHVRSGLRGARRTDPSGSARRVPAPLTPARGSGEGRA
jgi:cytochrome c oxidase assembly protein subunit 15